MKIHKELKREESTWKVVVSEGILQRLRKGRAWLCRGWWQVEEGTNERPPRWEGAGRGPITDHSWGINEGGACRLWFEADIWEVSV